MLQNITKWVVVMFENRSFDNLLGHLPHIPADHGIRDRDIELPYPGGVVKVAPATDYTSPCPDPGEGFGNTNAQLWNTYIPESNRGKSPYPIFPNTMENPQNVPSPITTPTMDGFALDYYWNFVWQKERKPTDEEMQQIGKVYTPETAPVINALASEYAVFTQWFCEAPTCTYPNRSFFHCGTSMGHLDNDNLVSYAWKLKARNLFDLLTEKGVDWKAYYAKDQVVPDASINLAGLRSFNMWRTHSEYREDFFIDAANGTLPTYSWVEPKMMFGDMDDYHPPHDVRAGEKFLASVYNAVRQGPDWESTALIVTFDEHGGTFDHVPPPAAVTPDAYPGDFGFEFDRLGVRVPTIVISPYTKRGTVITDQFQATSVLRTMRERFDLGPPLTCRDTDAPLLTPAFNLRQPRTDCLAEIELPEYEYVKPTKAEKEASFGDVPDPDLLLHKIKAEKTEQISQLGEATLRNVADLLHIDPSEIPTTAAGAQEWLTDLVSSRRLANLKVPTLEDIRSYLPHRGRPE